MIKDWLPGSYLKVPVPLDIKKKNNSVATVLFSILNIMLRLNFFPDKTTDFIYATKPQALQFLIWRRNRCP